MLVLPLGFVAAQVDLTLEPNATGCEVAMAVIDKINLFTDFSKQLVTKCGFEQPIIEWKIYVKAK